MRRFQFAFLVLLISLGTLSAQNRRSVVIPAQFYNQKFNKSQDEIKTMVKAMEDYFNEQFASQINYSFEVSSPVTLGKASSYYGANSSTRHDEKLEEAIREACQLANASVDFSRYDSNGDGFVDNVYIIFAGASEADGGSADDIWPQWNLLSENSSTIRLDNVTINSFCAASEVCGVGTLCHEFGHHLGLEDLYDTDGEGSGGRASGLWGTLSLMDNGLYNDNGNTAPSLNAIELDLLGAGSKLTLKPGVNILRPITSSHEYIRIETDNTNEYYLLEAHDGKGRDAFTGGKGMIIYHVDRSQNNTWYSDSYKRNLTAAQRWSYNQINCRPDHECADVVEAKPAAKTVSEVFFPQPGHNSFASETDPSFKYWSGNVSDIALTDIHILDDGSVQFNAITPMSISGTIAFQDAILIRWKVDASLNITRCRILCSKAGDKTSAYTNHYVSALEDGSYSFTIENLEPLTEYDIIIKAECTDGQIFTRTTSAMTRSRQLNKPFIWLGGADRNSDGSFQKGTGIYLRVFNAEDVAKVNWYFNGEAIAPDSNGMFAINEDGTLKAFVFYEKGGIDIIQKEVCIK